MNSLTGLLTMVSSSCPKTMKIFRSNVFLIITLALLTFLAFGQTLLMYFWIDDNGLIYKLQHIDTFSGIFGRGIVGEGPYRHIVDQFVPFYPIFETNPLPYYAVGLLLYFFAALTLYFFTKALNNNRIIAAASAAIFASGYIGSESMFGIINSWQTSRGIIMALITFWLYLKYINSKKILYYFLSIGLFYLSLNTVFIRAHGLFFAFLAFDILFFPVVLNGRSVMKFLLRQIPFLYIYYQLFLIGSGSMVQRFGILQLLTKISEERKVTLLFVPFENLGNIFIPDFFAKYLDQFVSRFVHIPQSMSFSSTIFGLLFLISFVYLIRKYGSKNRQLARIIIFSLIWIISNIFLYITKDISLVMHSTHRYFSYSFVGLALFWAVSFYLLTGTNKFKKNIAFLIPSLVIVLIYLGLGIAYEYDFNLKRSFPIKQFFNDFRKAIPEIPKEAVIFMNLENSNITRSQFGNFFGGMFSEHGNLAIYSKNIDYSKDFLYTYDFEEALRKLKTEETSLDKFYSFYYSKDGLVDVSGPTRELLKRGRIIEISLDHLLSQTTYHLVNKTFTTQTEVISDGQEDVSQYPVIFINLPTGTPSFVPAELTFSMKLTLQPFNEQYSTARNGFKEEKRAKEKDLIIDYLLSRDRYRKEASVSAGSFWKEQEPKLALDGRLETAWRSNRGFWDQISRGQKSGPEFIETDLGKILNVNQVKWVSAQRPLVPTHYKIMTSLDKQFWKMAKEVISWNALAEGTIVIDNFAPTDTRYVKMEILKTFGDDGPELKEFEVIESKFSGLDQEKVKSIEDNPFWGVRSLLEYNRASDYIKKSAKLRIYWMSDADDSNQDPSRYLEVPLYIDNEFHPHSVDLPPTGIRWIQFTLSGINFPVDVVVSNPALVYHQTTIGIENN